MKNKTPLEIYVHIPFCAKKCEYCDFLSGTAPWSVEKAYYDKLIEEINCLSARYSGYEVSSIFIGGGTPSLFIGRWIAEIVKTIRLRFDVQEEAEITIEANPGTLNSEKLEQYKECGVNRISLGLQSADDEELKLLGRIHSFDDFLKSYERVRYAGFSDVNVDLMSALPGQTLATWKNTLKKVTMLKPEHISAYSLIIEEGTPFYDKFAHHTELLPDEDTEREMYELTGSFLESMGYERYEISNYAKPGYECKHNIGYWTGVDYLGFGLGASSYIGGFRYHNTTDLKKYLSLDMKTTDVTESLYEEITELSEKNKMEEFMFLGLRMMRGVSGKEFINRFGQNMWNVYGDVIHSMEKEGLMEINYPYAALTKKGIDLSNYVMSKFLL